MPRNPRCVYYFKLFYVIMSYASCVRISHAILRYYKPFYFYAILSSMLCCTIIQHIQMQVFQVSLRLGRGLANTSLQQPFLRSSARTEVWLWNKKGNLSREISARLNLSGNLLSARRNMLLWLVFSCCIKRVALGFLLVYDPLNCWTYVLVTHAWGL